MTDYIWIVWDVIAIVIIFWCVRASATRGFLRTLLSVLSYIISAAVARYLSPPTADYIYDKFVREALVTSVEGSLGETIASGRDFAVKLIESFPKILRQYLPLADELAESYYATNTRKLIEDIVEAAVKEPVLTLLQSLCFMLVFSAAIFILRHFSRIFTGIYKIPVIGPLNTFLGGVTGLVEAVVFMLVGVFIMELAIYLSHNELWWLNTAILDNTFIWRVFYGIVS